MEVKSYQVTVSLKKTRPAPQIAHKSIFGNSNTRQKLLLKHGNHCSVLTPSERLWYEQHLSRPAGDVRRKVQPPSLVASQSSGEHQAEEDLESISLWKYQPWQSSTQRTYALKPGPRCHQLVSLTNSIDMMTIDTARAPSLPDASALLPFLESSEEAPVIDTVEPAKSKKKKQHEANKRKTSKSTKSSDSARQSPQKGRQKSILEHFAEMRSTANDVVVVFDSHTQESRGDFSPVRSSLPKLDESGSGLEGTPKHLPRSDGPSRIEHCSASSSDDESGSGLWSDASLPSPTPFDYSVDRELLLAALLVCLRTRSKEDARRRQELKAFVDRENDVRWLDDLVVGKANKAENLNDDENDVHLLNDMQLFATAAEVQTSSQLTMRNKTPGTPDINKNTIVESGSKTCEGSPTVTKNTIPEYDFTRRLAASTPIVKSLAHVKAHCSRSTRTCDILNEVPDIPMDCPLSSIKKSPLIKNRYRKNAVEDSTSPVIATSKSRKFAQQRTSAKRLFSNDLSTIHSGDEESAAQESPSNNPLELLHVDRNNVNLEPGKPKSISPLSEQEGSSNLESRVKKKLVRFSAPVREETLSTDAEILLSSQPLGAREGEEDLKTFLQDPASRLVTGPDAKSGCCPGPLVTAAAARKGSDLLLPTNFVKHSAVTSKSDGPNCTMDELQNSVQKHVLCSFKPISDASAATSQLAENDVQRTTKSTSLSSIGKRQRNKKCALRKSLASKITFDLRIDDLLGSLTSDVSVLNAKFTEHKETSTDGLVASNLSAKSNGLPESLSKKYPDFFEDDFGASCELSLFTNVCNNSESIKLEDSHGSQNRVSLDNRNLSVPDKNKSLNKGIKKYSTNETAVSAGDKSNSFASTLLSLTQAVAVINESDVALPKSQCSPLERSMQKDDEDPNKHGIYPDVAEVEHGMHHSEIDGHMGVIEHFSPQSDQVASASNGRSLPVECRKIASPKKKSTEEAVKAIEDLASLIKAQKEDLFQKLPYNNSSMDRSFDLFDEDRYVSFDRCDEVLFAPETLLNSQRRRKTTKLSRKVKYGSSKETGVDRELPEWQSQECDLAAVTSSDLSFSSCANLSLSSTGDNFVGKIEESVNAGLNRAVSDHVSNTSGSFAKTNDTILLNSSTGSCLAANRSHEKEKVAEKASKTIVLNADAVTPLLSGLPTESLAHHLSSNISNYEPDLKDKTSDAVHRDIIGRPATDTNVNLTKNKSRGVAEPLVSKVSSSALDESNDLFSSIRSSQSPDLLAQPQVQSKGMFNSGNLKAKRKLSLKGKHSATDNATSCVLTEKLSCFKHNEAVNANKLRSKSSPDGNENFPHDCEDEMPEVKKVKFDLTTNNGALDRTTASSSIATRTFIRKNAASSRESFGQNLAEESALASDVSVLQPRRSRGTSTGRVITSDTSAENESFEEASGNDESREAFVASKSHAKSTVGVANGGDSSPHKSLDASADSCSSEDFDFCVRAPCTNVAEIPGVARKKSSVAGGRCQFVNTEADVSHDSRVVVSSDEEEGSPHDESTKYDESFVDDRHQPTQEAGVDMRGVYLRSVRSPALKSKLGPSTSNWRSRRDVCSQPYEYVEDESYVDSDDSFVVANDCVEYESQLPLGNDAEDSLMVPRCDLSAAAPSRRGKKRKRIVLADSSSDDDR